MTRRVRDAALMLQALVGSDKHLALETKGELRLGVPPAPFYKGLDPDIQDATRSALAVLATLGGRERDVTLATASDSVGIVLRAEAYAYHEPMITRTPELYQPETLRRNRSGAELLQIGGGGDRGSGRRLGRGIGFGRRRGGAPAADEEEDDREDGPRGVSPRRSVTLPRSSGKLLTNLSGQAPPAGPQWVSRLAPLEPQPLAYDKPLCVSLDGFTLHAATRAGALDPAGREALLRYVLRPPVAQERVEQRPDGLVRITLKKAHRDGTVAVDMDPLSLLCRLATSVPPPRFHTVKYSGVLAPASPWRSRRGPPPPQAADASAKPDRPAHPGTYRPWAELLARTFAMDVLVCATCPGGG